jgi:hypothetical protein
MSSTKLIGVLGVALAVIVMGPFRPGSSAAQESDAVALKAIGILQQNCGSSGCHGGADPYSFDVRNLPTLVEAKVLEPGKAAKSEIVLRLEAGVMPLGGYKGQAGAKMPDADIKILKQWIDAGAPDPGHRVAKVARPFVSEPAVLSTILRDLESASDRDRQFLRYYSVANLWNSADIDDKELSMSRGALSKLVNHLSWDRGITQPKPLGPEGAVLRIDLRDYGWTHHTWNRIVASYPYGARTLTREEDRIRALSGVLLPYIRLDWFVANASMPALYHDILQLPDTLDRLEDFLRVDSAVNVQIARARRFGVRNSGVSRNNRAVERHPTAFGAYWKSFDFATNRIESNIFRNPIDLDPDGGEIIFNLPNGLQAYLIVDRQGKRIADAPVNIVRDRTNADDPVVHNGRSCISCHIKGANPFRDEIAATLQTRVDAIFSLSRAESLYPGQVELDRLVEQDNAMFKDALLRTGNQLPTGVEDEPVGHVAKRHEGTVSVIQAAADLFIQDPKQLQTFIGRSPQLQRLGFDQLVGPKGGIKRDTWEEGFGLLVQEARLGDFLTPGSPVRVVRGFDQRVVVTIGSITGRDGAGRGWGGARGGPVELVRQQLISWLSRSDDIRVAQTRDRADFNLTGIVTQRPGNRVSIEIREPSRNLIEEITGAQDDLDFLMQQLANRINFKIGGAWLPTAVGGFSTVGGGILDPIGQLLGGVESSGPSRIVLNTDLGPGATYRSGEEVRISFRAASDCFFALFSVDSSGSVHQLFPATGESQTRLFAGQVVRLVDSAGRSLVRVDPNGIFGVETLVGVAADSPGRFQARGTSGWDSFSRSLKTWSAGGAGALNTGIQDVAVLRFFTAP